MQKSPLAIPPAQGHLLFQNPRAASITNSDLYGDVLSGHLPTLPNERDAFGSHLSQTNYILNYQQKELDIQQDYKSRGLLPTIEIKKT